MKEIIIALITGLCAVIGQWIISRNQAKNRKVEEAIRAARLEDRLSALEKRFSGVEDKIDEHNGYAKLFAEVKTDIAVIKNDIKTLYKSSNQ